MKIEKDVLTTTNNKKEAITMIKKYLAITLTALIVLFNVLPAQAYSPIYTGVAITATGNLTGNTIAFTSTLCAQGTGTDIPSRTAPFGTVTNPTLLSDSGAAIKISGGSNEATGRIIIYTDNGSLLGDDPTAVPPTFGSPAPSTGADGAGMVGVAVSGYQVPMIWGATDTPNTNSDYTFPTPANFTAGIGGVYIVDKRHSHTYTTKSNVASSLDSMPMYTLAGTTNVNVANDGLYPQAFDQDYYDLPAGTSGRKIVSEALYKNIATLASGIAPNNDAVTPANSSYVCNVPKLSTAASDDSVVAKLAKCGSGTTDNYLYVHIGADFRNSLAQAYSTTKLYVAIVKD